MARLAVPCDNLLELCDQAAERGVELVSEPVIVHNKNGTTDGWVCLEDPEGTIIELIQFRDVKAPASAGSRCPTQVSSSPPVIDGQAGPHSPLDAGPIRPAG